MNALDNSVVAAICHIPDLTDEEIGELVSKIEDPQTKTACRAISGQVNVEELTEDQVRLVLDIQEKRLSKIRRVRDEQIALRRKGLTSSLGQRMIDKYERGEISYETLLVYGVSGTLPDRKVLADMTDRERQDWWDTRMTMRFGVTWREITPIKNPFKPSPKANWKKEGF